MNAVILVHEANAAGLPVVTGCPFLFPNDKAAGPMARATQADGTKLPVQTHSLTPRNEEGVEWIELSLMPTQRGEVSIELLPESKAEAGLATESEGTITLANAQFRCILNAKPGVPPIVIETGAPDRQVLGSFAPELVSDDGAMHREAEDSPREVRLLRNGPLRAQAELSGQLSGPGKCPSLSYRLTVELWKDIGGFRLDWMLSHLIPRQPFLNVHRASLVGTFDTGADTANHFIQENHSDFYRPREVVNPHPVALESNFDCATVVVQSPDMLLDEAAYAPFLPGPHVQTREWLAVVGEQAGVLAALVDFAATRPNRLRGDANHLTYDLIPAGHPLPWPQGRRKEQTLLLAPTPGAAGFDGSAAYAAALTANAAGRAAPAASTLQAASAFDFDTVLPYEVGKNVRFSRFLNGLCHLRTPGDKWCLGDTIDSHYSRSYPGVPNRYELKPGAPSLRPTWSAGGALMAPEIEGLIQPVWTNNEYDIIHALAQEACRGGKSEHLRTLRWAARHNIEVDFVALHDHSMHHRAMVAHSPHHNTTGAYPSHFWTQGLLQYYLLSGDRDALEICLALGDKTLECLHDENVCKLKFDREFGWGLLALVCLVEHTGIERFRTETDRIVDYLVGYDREAFAEAINLSAGDARRCMDRQIVDCAFGYVSMIEAIDRYLKLFNRASVKEWFGSLLLSLKRHGWDKIDEGEYSSVTHIMHILAIGYEQTGDEDFLLQGEVYLDATFGPFGSPPGPGLGETKPNASAYRALHRFLGHANRAGLLEKYELPTLRARREH